MVDTTGQLILPAAAKEHEGEWSYEVNNTFGSDDVKFKGRLIVKSIKGQPLAACVQYYALKVITIIIAPESEYLPVPASEYGVHVNRLHANKNRLFEEQFEVCSC